MPTGGAEKYSFRDPANMVHGRPSKASINKKKSLAFARKIRLGTKNFSTAVVSPPTPNAKDAEDQDTEDKSSGEETGWSGGVTHCISSDEEPIFVSDDDEGEVEELSGSELEEAVRQGREGSEGTTVMSQSATTVSEGPPAMLGATVTPKADPNPFSAIMGQRTNHEWKKAERTRSLGYNGQSDRTKRRQEKALRDKEKIDAELRKG